MTPEERIKLVAPIARSILPDTATPLERALLSVELASLAEIDISLISKIWNPHEVPLILLPWLAWALSVDVWDDNWPEKVKRRVVAATPMVHRLKGTRIAVERSLQSIGYKTTIEEWWEQEPVARRGTFKIEVIFNTADSFLTESQNNFAYSAVMTSKPKARVFELHKILLAQTNLYLGCYNSLGGRYTASLKVEPEVDDHVITLISQVVSGGKYQARMEID